MVSIVEVEIFSFLQFSNWPDFDQKYVILGLNVLIKWLKYGFDTNLTLIWPKMEVFHFLRVVSVRICSRRMRG